MGRLTALLIAAGIALAACGGDSGSLVADAGDDFTVAVGEVPTFDGCGSEGEFTNYEWTIIEAPDSQPDADGKPLRTLMADCSFELENAMIIDDVGEWTIELAAISGETEATDQVVVTVTE